MPRQDVDDASVLPDLLTADVPIDTVVDDGAYDTKDCHAAIATRGAEPSIPPREGVAPWSTSTSLA